MSFDWSRAIVFEQLLFSILLIQSVTFLRLLQRRGGIGIGYTLLTGAVLGAALGGYVKQNEFIGSIAIGVSVVTVILPWLLERLAGSAYARQYIRLAVRLSGIRAFLMLGSGRSSKQNILQAFVIHETKGLEEAVKYLTHLRRSTEDDDDLGLIHENIVSLYIKSEHWHEAVQYFEQHFRIEHISFRPLLALGLMQAYGECFRVEDASRVLRTLESGPFGSDPRGRAFINQARFTFLAYAGQAPSVDLVVANNRVKTLGLSAAAGSLFHGIALLRAGDNDRAEAALRNVSSLARRSDTRALQVSQSTLESLPAEAITVDGELLAYAKGVSSKLHEYLYTAGEGLRAQSTYAAYGLMFTVAFVHGLQSLQPSGTEAVLNLGALTPELWAAGSWQRLFTAPWHHLDFLGLLVNSYSIWLAAQVVELVYGPARMVVAVVLSAVVGLLAGVLLDASSLTLMGGGQLLAIAALVSGLWSVVRHKTPEQQPNRTYKIMLTVLLALNAMNALPSEHGFDTSPWSILFTVLTATVCMHLPKVEVVKTIMTVVALALGLTTITSFILVGMQDTKAVLHSAEKTTCINNGVQLTAPSYFGLVQHPLHHPFEVYGGIADKLALRSGEHLEIFGMQTPEVLPTQTTLSGDTAVPALLADRPALLHAHKIEPRAVPEQIALGLGQEDPASWRAFSLVKNGTPRTLVVEHHLAGRIVTLVASPPSVFDRRPENYAQIMLSATKAAEPATDTCK